MLLGFPWPFGCRVWGCFWCFQGPLGVGSIGFKVGCFWRFHGPLGILDVGFFFCRLSEELRIRAALHEILEGLFDLSRNLGYAGRPRGLRPSVCLGMLI